ncbi:hypothetical protein C0J52_05407, partial [Blattella germanica]
RKSSRNASEPHSKYLAGTVRYGTSWYGQTLQDYNVCFILSVSVIFVCTVVSDYPLTWRKKSLVYLFVSRESCGPLRIHRF